MDVNTKMANSEALEVLVYWKNIPLDDVVAFRMIQKTEQTINAFVDFLHEIDASKNDSSNQYSSFVWSISIRDFIILLRDSLLASTKFEQLRKDDKLQNETSLSEIQRILQKAAKEVLDEYTTKAESKIESKIIKHQDSPIKEVIHQLEELQKQVKKIFRSSDKIDDLRFNISEYIKDFHLQYSKQKSAVEKLLSIVDEVKQNIETISTDSTDIKIEKVVDSIGDSSQQMELIQGTESIEILPYVNRETLSIPVETSKGSLRYKSINVKSEFARSFSSFIYPKLIELESKRDHAVEKCLLLFSQIRTKIAAISMSDIELPVDFQREFEGSFSSLKKEVLDGVRTDVEHMNELVSKYQSDYLVASNVYSDEFLFLPDNGGIQISSLGKDAQKRITNRYNKYSGDFKSYLNKVLSRYIEIEKTPYSQYVKNKLSIYDKDDSMALFLKNGYLGKSFTVQRPELIDRVINDYNLWLEGFAGAILLSGPTGSGKSTLLGIINNVGLAEEIIQLKVKESYFIEHRAYEPSYNIKELIEEVLKRTKGRRIIISIDDLGQWHDDENELYDNINKLHEAIIKYRKRVFFIVTCTPLLRERIQLFKDVKSLFSSSIKMVKMNTNQLRTALDLRAKVNERIFVEDANYEASLGNVIRESRGNPGYAMLEYCRFHNDSYKLNVKSQEFIELINSYYTLLTYISSYHYCSIKRLSESLSDMDFRDTIKSIDHLVGQKILVRPKKGYISINPLLVHSVEKTLLKLKM